MPLRGLGRILPAPRTVVRRGWDAEARREAYIVPTPVEILSTCPHVLSLRFLKDEFLVSVTQVVAAFQTTELRSIGRIPRGALPLCQGSVLPRKYFREIPFQEKLVVTEICRFSPDLSMCYRLVLTLFTIVGAGHFVPS